VRNLLKGFGKCGAAVLIRELGLQHVHAAMCGMRARATVKYPTLATHAALFASGDIPHSKWRKASLQGLRRLGLDLSTAGGEAAAAAATAAATAANNQLWTAAMDGTKGARFYNNMGFGETASYLRTYLNKTERLDDGVKMLIAARCAGLWTGASAAKRGLIPDLFLSKCPHCHGNVNTNWLISYGHILCSCTTWAAERATHLEGVMSTHLQGHGEVANAALLLGGKIGTHASLPNWQGTIATKVIRFFNAIAAEYRAAIWRHASSESLGPSGYGSSSQGPG
jgi:hypothetical protein